MDYLRVPALAARPALNGYHPEETAVFGATEAMGARTRKGLRIARFTAGEARRRSAFFRTSRPPSDRDAGEVERVSSTPRRFRTLTAAARDCGLSSAMSVRVRCYGAGSRPSGARSRPWSPRCRSCSGRHAGSRVARTTGAQDRGPGRAHPIACAGERCCRSCVRLLILPPSAAQADDTAELQHKAGPDPGVVAGSGRCA